MSFSAIAKRIFEIKTEGQFNDLALEIFQLQASKNPVYAEYIDHLGLDPAEIAQIEQIPFLPIELFKTHRIITGDRAPEIEFTSSGTSGSQVSRHRVSDLNIYERSFEQCFEQYYGAIADYRVLALLPSYLERGGSSLIYMVDAMINKSKGNGSGFYLDDLNSLSQELRKVNTKTMLIGVSFALLELAEKEKFDLKNTIVMETGGMKGRRKEMTRTELHRILKDRLGIASVHSEYGMTELLSQAYATADGKFGTPPWMRLLIRDINDPFTINRLGKTGGINVIDLANIHSCSFLATQDLGRQNGDGSTEILGRFDFSDLRGCNLMVAD